MRPPAAGEGAAREAGSREVGPDGGEPREGGSSDGWGARGGEALSLEALVAAFEGCALSPDAWGHREHLAVAAWYVRRLGADGALERMRAQLRGWLAANGIETTRESGYHETITRFWLLEVEARLAERPPGEALAVSAAAIADALADKRLILERYDRETLMSWEARRGWAPPER